jgi:hypothetical protein
VGEPTATDAAPSGAPRPDVSFDVEVTPGPTSVAVSWSLTNTGTDPLLVVNRLPRASGATVVYDPEVAYVVGGDDGLVQIASQLFDVPETDRLDSAQLPRAGATEVEPGDVLTQDLTVPVPLVRSSPWGDDLGDGPIELPYPVTSVQYCLGVVAGSLQPSWGAGRTGEEILLSHGGPAVGAQHVLCSDPIPLG